jgi:hypothetical protein
MKIVDGFVLKNIANSFVVVPLGSNTVSFRSIISLNETGAFLWELLKTDKTKEELISGLLAEYDVDKDTAQKDVNEFINSLNEANLLV